MKFQLGRLLTAAAAWAVTVQGYWMGEIKHQGVVPRNPDPANYKVFRNVRDFGAVGDGVTDDTEAIKRAMAAGKRCAPFECVGSTTTPAVVYFPAGTYVVSSPIVVYFYTQVIGDAASRPILKASAGFNGAVGGEGTPAVLDGIPTGPNGALAWLGINTFFRQIRNVEIDLTAVGGRAVGVHWPTGQATSISNVRVRMAAKESGRDHVGIVVSEGSGGFMSDVELVGGRVGAVFANQQFTMRNMRFIGCGTAVDHRWDWTWTYQGLLVDGCNIGLKLSAAAVGSLLVEDSEFRNTPVAIVSNAKPASEGTAGTLALNNVKVNAVGRVLEGPGGEVLLPGGDAKTVNYIQGKIWDPAAGNRLYTGDNQAFFGPQPSVTNQPSKPLYEKEALDRFISARDAGCAGNGQQDDTECLNRLFARSATEQKIAFLDAGHYVVRNTVYIPGGARVVGEALASVILATGPQFANMAAPRAVVQVGKPGENGRIEWSDTVVSSRGAAAGAKLIEYNLFTDKELPPSGLWDVHVRVGGFAGSEQQVEQCVITPDISATVDNIKPGCIAGFISMHLTPTSGGLYTENIWLWVADHDIESQSNQQITVFVGRGMLVESTRGRVWMVGSGSEHHTLYNYQLRNTRDIYMGLIQTETPYYQPNPPAFLPFPAVPALADPDFRAACAGADANAGAPCAMAWGLRVLNSQNIKVAGTGMYSFFSNNKVGECKTSGRDTCQRRMVEVVDVEGPRTEALRIYNLNSLGSVSMVTRFGQDVLLTAESRQGFNSDVGLFLS